MPLLVFVAWVNKQLLLIAAASRRENFRPQQVFSVFRPWLILAV